jgi:2-phosphoglycerate kinase
MISNLKDSKAEHIYVVADESNISFKPFEGDKAILVTQIQSFFKSELIIDEMKMINGISYLNLEILNVIDKNLIECRKSKSNNLIYKKLNKEKLVTIFKCLGFNLIYCPQIAEEIYYLLNMLVTIKNDTEGYMKSTVIVKQSVFYSIAKHIIKSLTGSSCKIKKYFNLSYLIISKTIPIIVLLGGTSGTGKSTVASLVASRLGISTVLSTDTIRHIMRNFLSKEEVPVLFASTYEAWKYVDKVSEEEYAKKVLKGYCEQSKIVGEKLLKVIQNILLRQECVVIEGVHLTVDIIKSIMKLHKYTYPFLIYIDKSEKHKERFAVRSKQMTLDPMFNKYVENFDHIRTIQSFLVKKSDRFLLPKIDNTNVDKSIGMIQETILRSFKYNYVNNIYNYDTENDNLSNYFNNFSKLKKTLLSSKEANILISQKVNKNFIMEKFFSDNNNAYFTNNQFNINSFKLEQLLDEFLIKNNENSKRKNSSYKKECLSDDEVILNNKNIIDNKNTNEKQRINYQMENTFKRNDSKKKNFKGNSAFANKRRKQMESFDEKDTNTSNKFGSIDSQSINERIKVINETDDELESIEAEKNDSKSK